MNKVKELQASVKKLTEEIDSIKKSCKHNLIIQQRFGCWTGDPYWVVCCDECDSSSSAYDNVKEALRVAPAIRKYGFGGMPRWV